MATQQPAPPRGASLISPAHPPLQLVARSRRQSFSLPSPVHQVHSGDVAEGEGGVLSSRALPEGWAPMAPSLRVGRTAVGATWSLCTCFLDETPFVQLDFEQIAAEIHFRREIVERCIHETLLFFAGALRDNKEVEFSFKGIGILAVRRKVVSMTFVDDCLLELDGTGNMPAALLGDSKMMRTVAFAGKNDFSRLSRDEVITLPRLALETPHQPSAPAISLKPRREPAPWGGGARRVSVLDPVFLAQRRVSLARQRAKEGEQAKAKEAGQARVLPVIREKSQEELKQPRPPAQPRLQLPACVPQPSGTGTGSLRTERAEKRLRLLMASKRREVEADVWRQYHASRAGQNTERGQSPCRHVFEDPYRPPHLLRKAYAEKLKEGLQEKERCQSAARQRASEGPAELHLPGRPWAV
ncbi:uncharacterized protein [Haliaeetus albicilla]|uniref:uncharacterized protein n=1 Tax=Haliaeetus albicilla TaxID=8969 RepID=UPI0037E8E71B